jgi:hypothetical protein
MNTTLNDVKLFKPGAPHREFKELLRVFPESHFEHLLQEGFHFYHTTFWYPLGRTPENIFESIVSSLKTSVHPPSTVIGVEWWFSVLLTNATPQWLLSYHFDRHDLAEKDLHKLKHPDLSSVLFLNTVPYGELVVTDQVLTEKGVRPRQPKDMIFIRPSRNLYAVFPGHLYHGVIGRMWRPVKATKLRVTMAVNWWTEQPKASYLRDSCECMAAFGLDMRESGPQPARPADGHAD